MEISGTEWSITARMEGERFNKVLIITSFDTPVCAGFSVQRLGFRFGFRF